jgi:hypothetical protein
MRSCSLSVLVDETTEEIASVDSGRLVHASERRSDGWFRRLQPERPVRPVPVVVLDVGLEDLLEVPATHDEQPVQHSTRTVRIQRSAWALGVWLWGA